MGPSTSLTLASLQGDLLTLVEQVGIECFLEGLLALDVDAALFLFGRTGDFAGQRELVAACVAQLQFERVDVVSQRGRDGLSDL